MLASADAVVVPSRYEPFGIVALEAAAARTPVVVADTGGLTDLIAERVATASFAPEDARGLANAIDDVLSDAAGTRAAVAEAARVVTRRYAWPAVARRTGEVYELSRLRSTTWAVIGI